MITVDYINRLDQFGKVSYDALLLEDSVQVQRVPICIPESEDTTEGRAAISDQLIAAYNANAEEQG
jgi:hypothetical protein